MAGIGKTHLNAFAYRHSLAVGHALKLFQAADGVLHGVQGHIFLRARALGLPVAPFRLKFLDVGRIPQHNVAKLAGGLGAPYRRPEPVLVQKGNAAGMVNVGMGQKQAVQLAGSHGNRLVFIDIAALFHAAVDKKLLAAGGKQGAAAGYFMVGAQKCQFHNPLIVTSLGLVRPVVAG